MDAGSGEFPLNSHHLYFDHLPNPNPLVGNSQGRLDFVPHENTSNGWPSQYNIPYECPNIWSMGPLFSRISKASVLAQNGTASYTTSKASVTSPCDISNAFGRTDNDHFLQTSRRVEDGTSHCNISEAPSQNWNAMLNHLPSSYQSNKALMKNSMAFFPSSIPSDNARNLNDLCEASVRPTGSSLGKRAPYCHSDMNFVNAREFNGFGSNSCNEGVMEQHPCVIKRGVILSLQQEFENSRRLMPESDEHGIETKNNVKGEMEEKVDQKAQVEREERARQFISTDGSAVKPNLSCCLSTTDVDIPSNKVNTNDSLNYILETLHYLSEDLLSSDFDDSELKDQGRAILHSAINSLRAFSIKKQKAANEESLQARVYKQLWIDAEAALCALKYELQIAQMKIEVENHNKTKGKSQSSSISSSRNSSSSSGDDEESSSSSSGDDEDEIPIMADEKNPIDALPLDEGTGVDASAMARFKVLKDRQDSQNSPINIEQHLKLGVNEPEIRTSALKDDKEIEQSRSSTDEESDSCMVNPTFGGEGSSLSFEWELVEHL